MYVLTRVMVPMDVSLSYHIIFLLSGLEESWKRGFERRYGLHAQCSVALLYPVPRALVPCTVCRYGAM